MANELDEFDKTIENLKINLRKSFARVYASLKARELKTLRQLDAIRKQCQDDKDFMRNCVQNIRIRFDNESALLSNDYVSPEDDHMYSYKTIEELNHCVLNEELEAIEVAALKQITTTENCVCYVKINPEAVSKQFRDAETNISPIKVCKNCPNSLDNNVIECRESKESTEDDKSNNSDSDTKKIDPTDDWLNTIKSQTETEPSQVFDVMEHSTIACL